MGGGVVDELAQGAREEATMSGIEIFIDLCQSAAILCLAATLWEQPR